MELNKERKKGKKGKGCRHSLMLSSAGFQFMHIAFFFVHTGRDIESQIDAVYRNSFG
jgi:hypothetical protein